MAPRTGLEPIDLYRPQGGIDLRVPPGQTAPGQFWQAGEVWIPQPGRLANRHLDGDDDAANIFYTDTPVDHEVQLLERHWDSVSELDCLLVAGRSIAGGFGQNVTLLTASGTRTSGYNLATQAKVMPTAASISSSGDTHTFVGMGTDVVELVGNSFVAAVWTGVAEIENVRFLEAWESRLVGAHYFDIGGADYRGKVRFSDPANGSNWPTNNIVWLDPGDGEGVTGLVAWREYLYAFKKHKIYCFYGTHNDSRGNPVFDFEPVIAGDVGCVGYGACVAGRDGVYFMAHDGIYRIAGLQPPVKISGPIDPLFTSEFDGTVGHWFPSFGEAISGNTNPDEADVVRLHEHEGHLYVSNGAWPTKVQAVWVCNLETGAWFPWFQKAQAFCSWNAGGAEQFLFTGNAGRVDKNVPASKSSTTAFSSAKRFAFGPFMELGGSRVLRDVKVYGRGSVTVDFYSDYRINLPIVSETFDIAGNGFASDDGTLYKRLQSSVKGHAIACNVRLNTRQSQLHRIVGYFRPGEKQLTEISADGIE